MKITVDRNTILAALGHIQSVVERKSTIPILANVVLRVAAGQLQLTGTDMDMEIVEAIPVNVERKGAITLPAHMLHDIVRKLPADAVVEIDAKKGAQVTVRAGRSTFRLGCLPIEDFPTLDTGDMGHTFVMPAADLRAMIDRTRHAISTEETRFFLNGIYLCAHGGALRAVATDGHRLARVDRDLPHGAAGMPGVIMPRKMVSEVRKLIDAVTGDITLSLSGTKIQVTTGAVVVTSKLVDGTFPDCERVIPVGNDKLVEVDPAALADAVARVSIISGEKSKGVKLTLTRGSMVLSTSDPAGGSATEELDCTYSGPALEVGFNSRYLADALGQISGPTVRMELADAAAPTLVRDRGDERALYVLMPMRV